MFVKKWHGRLRIMNLRTETDRCRLQQLKDRPYFCLYSKTRISVHSSASIQGFSLILFREQFSTFLYVVFPGCVSWITLGNNLSASQSLLLLFQSLSHKTCICTKTYITWLLHTYTHTFMYSIIIKVIYKKHGHLQWPTIVFSINTQAET